MNVCHGNQSTNNLKIIIREEGEIVLNIIKEMTEKEIIKLCDEKIVGFSNISEDKIAICWPTDKNENKIELFADTIQKYGKALWESDRIFQIV